jgi:hypothetical protein
MRALRGERPRIVIGQSLKGHPVPKDENGRALDVRSPKEEGFRMFLPDDSLCEESLLDPPTGEKEATIPYSPLGRSSRLPISARLSQPIRSGAGHLPITWSAGTRLDAGCAAFGVCGGPGARSPKFFGLCDGILI